MSGNEVTMPVQILLQLMVTTQVSQNVTLSSDQKPLLADSQTSRSSVLPSGYLAFPEYRLAYKLFETEVTYNEAISLCSSENGQLAVIDSIEKVEKMIDHFDALQFAWIGIHLLRDTDGWTTIDGKSRSYLPWSYGEPSGGSTCGTISKHYRGLRNYRCYSKYPYLCEIPLPRN